MAYRQYLNAVTQIDATAYRAGEGSDALIMQQAGDITVEYAPFDHIERDAELVIVGLTPGRTQAANALTSLSNDLRAGSTIETALANAKRTASFSGAMRANLLAMLDAVGVPGVFGRASASAFFSQDDGLVHFTSTLRYPVYIGGQNYSGSPDPMGHPIDPRDAKKVDEAMKVTLNEVMDRYVIARGDKLKNSTATEMKRHVEKVFGDWKDQPIVNITEDMCRKRHDKMSREGLRGKPAPGQANISATTLRTLINFAGREFRRADGSPLIQRNPVVNGLSDRWAVMEPRSERYIDPKKVGDVWHMLTTRRAELVAAQQREDGQFCPRHADAQSGIELAMFLMLTGARRNEVATLEWKNVNLDEGWWHIPDPKNRRPVWLPLSDQAAEIIRRRKPIEGNRYVFTSRSKAGHVTDTRDSLDRISTTAGLTLSAHDLRRTFVSIGVDVLDIDFYKIERLTNHVSKTVTGRHYLTSQKLTRLAPEVKRIGDWIEEQGNVAEAKATGANVVAFAV